MDRALFVEMTKQRESNGEAEEPYYTEELGTYKQADQGYNGVQSNLAANDFRLNDISDHGNGQINDQQAQGQGKITLYQRNDHPGDHYTTGSKYGKYVEHSDKESNEYRSAYTDDRKTDGQFNKGDAHNQRIGANADKQRAHNIFFDISKQIPDSA